MKKAEKLAKLKKLLDEGDTSPEEYQQLKEAVINEEAEIKTLKFRLEKINWLTVIAFTAIIVSHFISSIIIPVEPWFNWWVDVEYGGNGNIVIHYFETSWGIATLMISIAGLVLSFLRFKYLWVLGINIGLVVSIFVYLIQGGLFKAMAENSQTNIFINPGFFYMLFSLIILFISYFKLKWSPPLNGNIKLSKAFKIFAIVGIVGSFLKLVQELTTSEFYNYYSAVYGGRWNWPVEEGFEFLKTDSLLTSAFCAAVGLCAYGFPLLILISQLFLLLRKRIFIYVFIVPYCLAILFKLFIFKPRFNAGGSEYFGYVMDIFWGIGGWDSGLHILGSIIFYYLMPLLFFYVYFKERHKLDHL